MTTKLTTAPTTTASTTTLASTTTNVTQARDDVCLVAQYAFLFHHQPTPICESKAEVQSIMAMCETINFDNTSTTGKYRSLLEIACLFAQQGALGYAIDGSMLFLKETNDSDKDTLELRAAFLLLQTWCMILNPLSSRHATRTSYETCKKTLFKFTSNPNHPGILSLTALGCLLFLRQGMTCSTPNIIRVLKKQMADFYTTSDSLQNALGTPNQVLLSVAQALLAYENYGNSSDAFCGRLALDVYLVCAMALGMDYPTTREFEKYLAKFQQTDKMKAILQDCKDME